MSSEQILIPDIGDFENVEIIEILTKPGAIIKKNDPVVTLESDKSSVEVPSPFSGKISSLEVKIGDKVSKGSVLVTIEDDKTEILKNVKFLHREMTPFQELRVYDTLAMGRILVLDGAVQIATNSLKNDNYTKDMTRFNITKEKEYEHIIIIGGGDL